VSAAIVVTVTANIRRFDISILPIAMQNKTLELDPASSSAVRDA
jgi:hypothetical protein